jgi:DHA3 family tetracycline resistance protein-like MFS transporter
MKLLQKKPSAYAVFLILEGASALFLTMIFTVAAVYRLELAHLNPLQLVLVGTVLEIAAFVFEVPTGVVADTYSRRVSVMIGVALIGAAAVFEGSIPIFAAILFAQVVSGLGYTFISGAAQAWITDEVGEEQVGRAYVRGMQVGQIGGLIGTWASVGLASLRLNLPMLVGGVLMMALSGFLLVAMPEHGFRPAPRGERSSWQTMGTTLRDGVQAVRRSTLLLLMLGIVLFGGAFSEGVDRLWQAHFLIDFTFPDLGSLQPIVWFGIISTGAQVINLVAAEIVRGRLDTTSAQSIARALLTINALLLVSMLLFGLATTFGLALAAYWAIALLRSLNGPLFNTWINQHISSQVRATVLSISSQSDALGQFIGGPILGTIGTLRSLRAAMVAAGLMLSPTLGLYAWVLQREPTATQAEAQVAAAE